MVTHVSIEQWEQNVRLIRKQLETNLSTAQRVCVTLNSSNRPCGIVNLKLVQFVQHTSRDLCDLLIRAESWVRIICQMLQGFPDLAGRSPVYTFGRKP